MVTETDIQNRIAEVQSKVEVPTYQDVAWEGAWKKRAAGLWGMMAVAMVMGAAIGALAPLFTILGGLEVAAAVALIPKSIAIFSAIGISTGLAIGAVVGPIAGAAAATMKEHERRDIARKIEDIVRSNPDMPLAEIQSMVTPTQNLPKTKTDYFNVKDALTFASFGAAGGLVFALALSLTGGIGGDMVPQFAMPAAKALIGNAATNGYIMTAYSAGLGGLFGANFGVDHPNLTRKVVNIAGDLLGGKSFREIWSKHFSNTESKEIALPELKPILSPMVVQPEREESPAVSEPKFSQKIERAPNYETMIAQAAKEAECGCNSRA